MTALCRIFAALVLPATLAVLAAPASALPALVTGSTVAPAPVGTQGIIMRDGGVCDPIRHMGC